MSSSRNWQKVKLSEILTQERREVTVDPFKEYALLGAHWYARGLYVKETKLGSQIKALKLYSVEEGDFVYNRLFAWKGSFAIATEDNAEGFVSNEFPCFLVNKDRVHPMFLWRYFSREFAWNEALGLSFGATPTSRNRLKEGNLLGMEIFLPPLSEQRRIVEKIERLTGKIEEAKLLRRSVDESVAPLALSLHNKISGNRVAEIGELVELSEERCAVSPDKDYPQVGIRGFGGGLFAKPALKGSDTTYKYFNRLKAGQIVLSQVKGWEGAIAVCGPELEGSYVSPEYRTFSCRPEVCDPAYMDHLLRTPWFHGLLGDASRGQGARRERTRPELFLTIKLPMPDIGAQRWAVDILQRVRDIPEIHAQTDAKLDALLPSILDKAFRGEL
jgi:type I restriction enzyme, S subunit